MRVKVDPRNCNFSAKYVVGFEVAGANLAASLPRMLYIHILIQYCVLLTDAIGGSQSRRSVDLHPPGKFKVHRIVGSHMAPRLQSTRLCLAVAPCSLKSLVP